MVWTYIALPFSEILNIGLANGYNSNNINNKEEDNLACMKPTINEGLGVIFFVLDNQINELHVLI